MLVKFRLKIQDSVNTQLGATEYVAGDFGVYLSWQTYTKEKFSELALHLGLFPWSVMETETQRLPVCVVDASWHQWRLGLHY